MLVEDLHLLLTKAGTLDWINYFELGILAVVVLGTLRLLLKTRAANMAKGLFVLVVLLGLATLCHLRIITYVLERLLYFFIVCGAVLFAPELRHLLERLGSFSPFRKKSALFSRDVEKLLNAVADAVGSMSRRKVGVLLCFEKNTDLREYIDSGIRLDAICSSGLLINIFEKNTPLHDGAVIIRNNRVVAATCYLPLTEQPVSKKYGTRHRAAIGLSEVSDALVVVVSEETGNISVARNGSLLSPLTPEDVMAMMVEHLYGMENVSSVNQMLAACFENRERNQEKKNIFHNGGEER